MCFEHAIHNDVYLEFCKGLVGAVIWERASSDQSTEYRRALVLEFRKASPAQVLVHRVRYSDGVEREMVLAVRDYVIEQRTSGGAPPEEFQKEAPTDMQADDAAVADDPDARVHTVSITCPEGFPVDMFLESVKPAIKGVLSMPQPGQAPMNRPPGSQYQWPDRGWSREAEFNTVLESSLSETGVGPVARGQTLLEAQVLVARLSSIVVAAITVDKSFVMAELSSSNPLSAGSSPARMCKGMQVHGLIAGSASDWLPATIVHAGSTSYSLAYSDGLYEELVSSARVRMPKPSNPRHGGDDSPIHEFLQRHLFGGSSTPANPLTSSAGQLECVYDAFETGSANRAGHIDMDQLLPQAPNLPARWHELEHMEQAPKLRVSFIPIPNGSNPKKRSVRDRVPASHRGPGTLLDTDTSLYHALLQLNARAPGVTPLQPPASRTHMLAYNVEPITSEYHPAPAADPRAAIDPALLHSIQALQLLHSIYGAMDCGVDWVNQKLTRKMLKQLNDPLAIASGATPTWLQLLPNKYPFLFSLTVRQKQLLSTGFGVSHSVNWVQTQVARARREQLADHRSAAERAAAAAAEHEDMEQMAEAAERLAEVEDEVDRERIGHLKSDIVKLCRENILGSAERLMAHHARSKAVLEVQFKGEDGFGSGVTQNFYCAVAVALQRRTVNAQVPMWVPDCGSDGYLTCASGLYPMPLEQTGDVFDAVCGRYLFLGRLMAKALRDGFIVPVPLSRCVLALVLGHAPSWEWLPSVDCTGGVVTGYANAVSHARRTGQFKGLGNVEFTRSFLKLDYEMSLHQYLTSAGACWVDPISGVALVAGGEDKPLVAEQLGEYVDCLIQWWFGAAVGGQIEAFRKGLDEVVPLSGLEPFSPAELVCMLCGDNSVDWDSTSLFQNLRPTASLTTNSPVFQLLVQYLLQLENKERAAFLNFVTACPRLPPGGVAALNIEVGPSQLDSKIPTSQTCVPRLYLPNYETIGDLQKGFDSAFKNAEAGGFHERGIY